MGKSPEGGERVGRRQRLPCATAFFQERRINRKKPEEIKKQIKLEGKKKSKFIKSEREILTRHEENSTEREKGERGAEAGRKRVKT